MSDHFNHSRPYHLAHLNLDLTTYEQLNNSLLLFFFLSWCIRINEQVYLFFSDNSNPEGLSNPHHQINHIFVEWKDTDGSQKSFNISASTALPGRSWKASRSASGSTMEFQTPLCMAWRWRWCNGRQTAASAPRWTSATSCKMFPFLIELKQVTMTDK